MPLHFSFGALTHGNQLLLFQRVLCEQVSQTFSVTHWERRPRLLINNQIRAAADAIAYKARQTAGHCFVYNQPPCLAAIRRKHKRVSGNISLGDFRLIEKSREANRSSPAAGAID